MIRWVFIVSLLQIVAFWKILGRMGERGLAAQLHKEPLAEVDGKMAFRLRISPFQARNIFIVECVTIHARRLVLYMVLHQGVEGIYRS